MSVAARRAAFKRVLSSSSVLRHQQPVRCFTIHRTAGQDKSDYNLWKKTPEYKLGKHRSNALELVEKQAIIEVDGDMAVCDGGGGALGHPIEYIKVGHRAPGEFMECIYCGLKYRKKASH